ncbi:hypothetical protein JK636_14400 [Clostridium sp. YIM B02515]|uniref:Uncharacterized protein n=1 Tax=Clostridium rhizosphaerae TaxID=2803861 RepID=A0ABS1TCE6_9CLOT|nr:hypothetical protein [Clostridium rhizosphaerae]MBL4936941.1 hypothetical protein [Clostridium rhizosphaerae]
MSQFCYNPFYLAIDMYDAPEVVAQDPPANGIGILGSLECYLDKEIYHNNCMYPYEIQALCRVGGWRTAYSSLNWNGNSGREPWSNHPSQRYTVNGYDSLIYDVVRTTNIYDGNANLITSLPSGSVVACKASEGCQSGATHKDWLKVHAYSKSGGAFVFGTAYVDTGIDQYSTSPSIRGNW